MINCRKLIRITSPFNLKPLAGKTGHNRMISWFHYIENPDYMDWLKGNEMILTTGMFIKRNVQDLLDFINLLYDHEAAGLILNLSPFIHSVPKEAIELCDFLGFPLFELEAKIRIVDISECICTAIIESTTRQNMTEQFIQSLIHDHPVIQDKLIRKAAALGLIQSQVYQTIFFQFSSTVSESSDTLRINVVQNSLHKFLEYCFKSNANNDTSELLFCIDCHQLILIHPWTSDIQSKKSLDSFIFLVEEHLLELKVIAGVSPSWKGLSEFNSSYENAKNALRFIPLHSQPKFLFYNELDISYLLLLNRSSEELNSLYKQTLSGLLLSDQNLSLDLTNTLEMYILENTNLNKTAELLFIHVNTLRYRLKKIEQLLACDLKNANALFSLHLALRIKRYMESHLISENPSS